MQLVELTELKNLDCNLYSSKGNKILFDITIFEQKIGTSIKFFNRVESEILSQAISLYKSGHHWSAGTLFTQLYEMRLTRFFIRRTNKPEGFQPSKKNIDEQLKNLRDREHDVIENRMSFYKIVDESFENGLISDELAARAKIFYKEIRIPVSHGLLNRLAHKYLPIGHVSEFHTDANFAIIAENMSNDALKELELLMEESSNDSI